MGVLSNSVTMVIFQKPNQQKAETTSHLKHAKGGISDMFANQNSKKKVQKKESEDGVQSEKKNEIFKTEQKTDTSFKDNVKANVKQFKKAKEGNLMSCFQKQAG